VNRWSALVAVAQGITVGLRIVPAVALNDARLVERPSDPAADRRNRVDQREQLGDVVPVRAGQPRDERNPLAVSEKRDASTRPCGDRQGSLQFFPPRSARRDALSTMARANRRQQVLPDPHRELRVQYNSSIVTSSQKTTAVETRET
jgi:hypothetical protein